jgi:hypothetical protein
MFEGWLDSDLKLSSFEVPPNLRSFVKPVTAP